MTQAGTSLIADILRVLEDHDAVVRVVLTRVLGSAPRNSGAAMIVTPGDFTGTIGGGRLEYEALKTARDFLANKKPTADHWPRRTQNFVLGTELKQCCGGVAWVLFEIYGTAHVPALRALRDQARGASLLVRCIDVDTPPVDITGPDQQDIQPPPPVRDTPAPALVHDAESGLDWFIEPLFRSGIPLFIYGAGHVGRALANVLTGTPFDITWVDTESDRFPEFVAADIIQKVAEDPTDIAAQTPPGAFHVVLTYSHSLDLEICRAVLAKGDARYLGLIASDTKRGKFRNRLRKDGIPDAAFAVFHSPIGLPEISGKEPEVVAISIAAQLLTEASAPRRTDISEQVGDLHVHS
ncbi:MAG: xanthine dehydrogenase accessory protein XdhC [Magnetospiraceae bacterium]